MLTFMKSTLRTISSVCPPSYLPEFFSLFYFQVPLDEYRAVLDLLMSQFQFACHTFCFSLPFSVLFFVLLLGVCLLVIPLIEFHFLATSTGLEYLHATVAWLCVLTIYMFCNHIAKQRVRNNAIFEPRLLLKYL